jgi:hypothetical protein
MFEIPNNEVPAIRIAKAVGGHYEKNLLVIVGGGLGDRACAEPTLRYIQHKFTGCDMSLFCDTPSLFRHIHFKQVYTRTEEVPSDKHLPIYTYMQGSLGNQFINPNLMHSVDFASVSAFRGQLPINFKQIVMTPSPPKNKDIVNMNAAPRYTMVHMGKSWPSRTLPVEWYNSIVWELKKAGKIAVLVGENCVDFKDESHICIDLRGKLSLNDYVWLCKQIDSIITNDSSPVHFGAAGEAKVAYVPTCRSPDLLTHWRKGQWGWRQRAFFKNKMWEMFPITPNGLGEDKISELPPVTEMSAFLPPAEEVVRWTTQCP